MKGRFLALGICFVGAVGLARAEKPRAGATPATTPTARPCGKTPAGMACVPGGEYQRGSDTGLKDERPAHRVWVDTFYMDLYEVTHSEYQACVKAGACEKAGPKYRARAGYKGFSEPKQPVVGVSWFNARQFCQSKGKRLPTEAEWEKAARSTDGRTYPWGNERCTCARAIIMDLKGRGCGVGKEGRGATWDVGSRPPGPYGLYDMAGNSWEWVADWYSPSYAACGKECEGPNPKGPCGGADECPGHRLKIVKGGSWYWPASDARAARRRPHVPLNRPFHHFGFRCAKSVE